MTRRLTLATLVLAIAALSGCAKKEREEDKRNLEGTIEAIDPSGGFVTVSTEIHGREVQADVKVTHDTEILIDGALAKLQDVRVGEKAVGVVKIIKEGDKREYVALRVSIDRAEPIVAPGARKETATQPSGGDGE